MKFRGEREINFIRNHEAIEKWADAILDYLESHIVFKMLRNGEKNNLLPELNKAIINGVPDAALEATDLKGIQYMCEWTNINGRKLMKGKENPEIVIAFLETKIDFDLVFNSENYANLFRGR